jgi:hypothetical protein
MFAAVALLALPMAQMILMLVVGSGIIGRVLVGNIVSAIKQQNSFLHVIANSEQEAAGFVARIFEDQKRPGMRTKFQIEIDGHSLRGPDPDQEPQPPGRGDFSAYSQGRTI